MNRKLWSTLKTLAFKLCDAGLQGMTWRQTWLLLTALGPVWITTMSYSKRTRNERLGRCANTPLNAFNRKCSWQKHSTGLYLNPEHLNMLAQFQLQAKTTSTTCFPLPSTSYFAQTKGPYQQESPIFCWVYRKICHSLHLFQRHWKQQELECVCNVPQQGWTFHSSPYLGAGE